MAGHYVKKGRRMVWVREAEVDPSPLYRVNVLPDGTLDHSGAFDPKYEGECEACGERFVLGDGHDACEGVHAP
jgi:hypothetical protein